MARVIWVLTGLAWAATSLLALAGPQYWDPVTTLDWTAVWVYTAAWLLFAPAIILLGRLASSRVVMTVAVVCAIGAVVAGGANALEDGFGVDGAGSWYVLGFLAVVLYLVPLALMLWRAQCRRLAGLTLGLFLGILLFTLGGGLIILAAFGALAIAADRFGPVTTAADEAPPLVEDMPSL